MISIEYRRSALKDFHSDQV